MEKQNKEIVEVKNIFPKRRQEIFANDSWGYKDCYFEYSEKDHALYLRGNRNSEIENLPFVNVRKIVKNYLDVDVADLKDRPSNVIPKAEEIEFFDNFEFRAALEKTGIDHSIEVED
jgi:hypothetical protein